VTDWAELVGPAEEVAPRLLGAVVRHGDVAVRLTEVEAYAGQRDPGSHAFRGRTRRNAVMFGPAGHLYCYFTYGMHVCANVVVGEDGGASAVLLRAGEVVRGLGVARGRRAGASDRDLARGPARLCRALGIGLDHDGVDLASGPVRLELAAPVDAASVRTGPRTGLRLAPDRPWRFWLAEERTVSPYRRHPKAVPGG
jgi:DNA-3-methyladenine glycosylase